MKFRFLLSILSIVLSASAAPACDLCGCYLPSPEFVQERPVSFFTGVSEQFTHFGTLQFNDREVPNPTGQRLESSVTQFVVGASFFENRLGLQVNVPVIYRSYERPEGFEMERGHEAGLGDVSVLANLVLFRHEPHSAIASDMTKQALAAGRWYPPTDFSATINLIAGLKLPTGDSSRIKEEFSEVEVEGAPESGIHGHDLTLGTGSFDAIFGLQTFLRYRAVFFQAETQFTLRGDGLHSYHFANDLTWDAGPGVYLYRHDRYSLGLACILSGETKDTDRFQGQVADDTGVTALYVGPKVIGQLGGLSAEVGAEFPVLLNTTKFQAVPDYRLHASLTYHF